MKIVNIIGGLGNQMFQYAFAIALQKKFVHETVCVDIQHFNYLFLNHYKSCRLHNGYEICKVFECANLKIASRNELKELTYYIPNYFLSRLVRRMLPVKQTEYIEDKNYVYYPEVFDIAFSCYYEGYWQSARYFIDAIGEIKKAFTFPTPNKYNSSIKRLIVGSMSVGIHIRRGDYLQDPEYQGICNLEYYKRALDYIGIKNKSFFIFSNDIEWCKQNIVNLLHGVPIIFVDGNKGLNSAWDMFLMSQCNELIIANSSFSWWGAFLNKKVKKVIVPKKWINRDYEADVYLDSWVKI